MFKWLLRENALLWGLVAKSEYDTLKSQNTDLWERIRTREDAIVEDLLTIKDLHVQVEQLKLLVHPAPLAHDPGYTGPIEQPLTYKEYCEQLNAQLLQEQYQSVEIELQRENAVAAYDQQVERCTALRGELEAAKKNIDSLLFGRAELQSWYDRVSQELKEANETIEKMAIEISGLKASLAKRLPGRPRKEVVATK